MGNRHVVSHLSPPSNPARPPQPQPHVLGLDGASWWSTVSGLNSTPCPGAEPCVMLPWLPPGLRMELPLPLTGGLCVGARRGR